MDTFDPVIGYVSIKQELRQIADTLKNRDAYEKVGAQPPRGLLLYGEPGVGKSLMASCLIEASDLPTYICRKNEPSSSFIKKITEMFKKAAESAPSIVFLDDIDKFANEDDERPDTEEYVTIQSCIDEMSRKGVFVLATANNIKKLPCSLLRVGRFDRRIEIEVPHGEDAELIIAHYLSDKELAEDVDPTTIARIMDGKSCAALEALINEAGIHAGYHRKKQIDMDDLVQAALRTVFGADGFTDEKGELPRNYSTDLEWQIALHEAGHTLLSEILDPGSTTLVSIQPENGMPAGFTSRRRNFMLDPIRHAKIDILISLGGPAAIECSYGFHGAGAISDFQQARTAIRRLITEDGLCGFSLLGSPYCMSDAFDAKVEAATATEMEHHYREAKGLILRNEALHKGIAEALLEKKTLLAKDLRAIKKSLEKAGRP